MSKQSILLFNKLNNHLKNLEYTRKKIEKLVSKDIIVKRDVEQVYKGLFLEIYSSFENFIEELFLGLLLDKYVQNSSVCTKVSFKSTKMARKVVFGGKPYVDWLPYKEHTVKRAKIFFRKGFPFTCLSEDEKNKLKECNIIRNVIAHKSKAAISRFDKEVIGSGLLPPAEKKPIGYLRGAFRQYPLQTRYENYLIYINNISYKIVTSHRRR